jgi:hypothetical protein
MHFCGSRKQSSLRRGIEKKSQAYSGLRATRVFSPATDVRPQAHVLVQGDVVRVVLVEENVLLPRDARRDFKQGRELRLRQVPFPFLQEAVGGRGWTCGGQDVEERWWPLLRKSTGTFF